MLSWTFFVFGTFCKIALWYHFSLNISSQSSVSSPASPDIRSERSGIASYTDSGIRRGVKRKRYHALDDSLYYQNTAKSYKVCFSFSIVFGYLSSS